MMKLSFDPFPILSSERLKFRAMHVGDVHEVFAMRSDPDTMKFIPRPLAKIWMMLWPILKWLKIPFITNKALIGLSL